VDPVKDALQRAADTLSYRVGSVFIDLEKMAEAVTAATDAAAGTVRRGHFLFLKNDLTTFIKEHSDLIEGAGIAYALGSLPEASHWLEWWRTQPDGQAKFVTHDLNPDSLNYYDYTTRDWFTLPAASGRATAVGPYVDFGGINVNLITLSVPARTAHGTHILGCDLILAKLEGIFLRALQLRAPAVVLLGPNGRVISSNTARFATGTLLSTEQISSAHISLPVSTETPTRLPWTLISLNPEGRTG
jgi:hypothetical protein